MDSVRFGRALGAGARNAVKAAVMAADAATTPNPNPQRPADPEAARTVASKAGRAAARTTTQVRQASSGVARGSRRFGEAVWGPFVKLSGVLILEVIGVFFGLFLLFAAVHAWKLRGSLHDTGLNHVEHQHLLFSIGMAVVFGYFCVSSFVRAARRGNGHR